MRKEIVMGDFSVSGQFASVSVPKIVNGSKIVISNNFVIVADRHFNWLQKRMMKLFFGFDVTDYSEEG